MTEKKLVLVVDDDELNRMIVLDIMGDIYECVTAADGQEAIAILQERGREFSLMLLDLIMPVVDGFGVLKWLQTQPWKKQLPVIVITSDANDEAIHLAYELGASAYLCRPVQPQVLVHNAEMFIRTTRELLQQEEKLRLLSTGDINEERVRLEEQDQANMLGSSLPGGFFMYKADESEEIIYVNDAVVEMFGCETEAEFRELVGNSFRGIVHPDDLDHVETGIVDQIKERNGSFDYTEYRIIRKDGTVARVEDHGRYVYTVQYGYVYYVFIKELCCSCEGHRPCVLVVDDQDLNRELLMDILSDTYDVEAAASGTEAIELLTSRPQHYDMMLLDLIMPQPDGFYVLEYMNKHAELFSLPVVVISSDTSLNSINRAYHLGALDVISRPYNASHVKRRLRNSIELFHRTPHPAPGKVLKKVLVAEASNLNRFFLSKILGDEYEILPAGNALEAEQLIMRHQEDLAVIILDLHMPEVNGYELMDWMKNRGLIDRIPIIAETVPGVYEENLHAIYSGAADYITKPYRLELVQKRVEGVISSCEMRRLLRQMKYDELTGVYEKQYFDYLLEKLLREKPQQEYDVVWTNIHGLKTLNDRYGMQTGNAVLRFKAEQLRKKSEAVLLARISADHFLLVYEHGFCNIEERLQEISHAFHTNPLLPGLWLSFGIYECVDHLLPSQQIYDRAMLAGQTVHAGDGTGMAYYDETIRQRLLKEQRLAEQMEQALKGQEFVVYYQPKFSLATDHIVGMEALVRWQHPQEGFISPGEFVPLFERNGFIRKLDRYVLEQVCRDVRSWMDRDFHLYPVSVNFSRRDFELEDYIETGYKLICDSGIPPELIHMEVTESMCSDDVENIIRQVERMRRAGIKVEMDDFGAGYSSLGMLTDMPLDVVKLDISFVRNMERKHKVIKSVIELSHGLGLEVVAEGVETKEQADALRALSCDFVQGYYFSRPLPREEVEKYLQEE